jgi:hypothetical protein
MIVRQVAIGQIKPNSKNARTHSTKQIRQIADSIVAFGFTNPLLVTEDGELIAGHGRYQAAKLLGLETVPVIVLAGLSPAKRRALAIADNKIAENAGWDRELLAIELPELADELVGEGLNISITGFEPVEILGIQTDTEALPQGHRDQIDPKWGKAVAVSTPGDLWLTGSHKLLCGDVCSGALARLMGDDRADLAFIDVLTTEGSPDLLSDALGAAAAVSRAGAIHFVGIDWPHAAECMAAAKPIYGDPIDLIVWVKSTAGAGTFYQSQHELIGMFRVGEPPHIEMTLHRPGRRRSNVWRYGGANSFGSGDLEALRFSPKPVALVADAIKDCTHKGDVVLDVSSGWGSTIMAAERVGRLARALEPVPRFVDLAIRRWQNLTYGEARHAESGLSFDQISADRTL